MDTGNLSARVIADRLGWIDRMLAEIRRLPLADHEAFMADSRNVWTAESCLRRALEALFGLGRHILAKGFGDGCAEYKEVATRLADESVLSAGEADLLRHLTGYRNRMAHFYHEISPDELYSICRDHLADVETIAGALSSWLDGHPGAIDAAL